MSRKESDLSHEIKYAWIMRLVWIAGQLRTGKPINCRTIAEHFGMCEKTANRYLNFLRDRMGYEMEYDPVDHHWVLVRAPEAIL